MGNRANLLGQGAIRQWEWGKLIGVRVNKAMGNEANLGMGIVERYAIEELLSFFSFFFN